MPTLQRKISFIFLILMGIILTTQSYAHSKGRDNGQCHPTVAGLYIGQIPGLTSFSMSNTPLSNNHNKMLIVIDTTGDADPTSRGLYPTAIGQSNPRGMLARNPRDAKTYEGQLARYRYDASGTVVGTEIQGVKLNILDCNTVEVFFVAQAFYFGYENLGMEDARDPDIIIDVSGFPSFKSYKMQIDHTF